MNQVYPFLPISDAFRRGLSICCQGENFSFVFCVLSSLQTPFPRCVIRWRHRFLKNHTYFIRYIWSSHASLLLGNVLVWERCSYDCYFMDDYLNWKSGKHYNMGVRRAVPKFSENHSVFFHVNPTSDPLLSYLCLRAVIWYPIVSSKQERSKRCYKRRHIIVLPSFPKRAPISGLLKS